MYTLTVSILTKWYVFLNLYTRHYYCDNSYAALLAYSANNQCKIQMTRGALTQAAFFGLLISAEFFFIRTTSICK